MTRRQQREPINCYDRTTDGNEITVAEIGYKSNGKAAVFLWCRAHRRFHACTLEQMLSHFYLLSEHDVQLRINYLTTLSQALVKVQEHDQINKRQESA